MRLLLVSTLGLDGQLGRPEGGISNGDKFEGVVNRFASRSGTDILNDPSTGKCRYNGVSFEELAMGCWAAEGRFA